MRNTRDWLVAREILDMVNLPWKKDIHQLQNILRETPWELEETLSDAGFDFDELNTRLREIVFPIAHWEDPRY